MSKRSVISMVNRLEDVGASPDGDVQLTARMDAGEASRVASDAEDSVREAQRARLDAMQQYAELSTCGREFLIRYFGDTFEGPCGSAPEYAGGTRREVG
jgi:ATP-dependent DNA helicase RecQ